MTTSPGPGLDELLHHLSGTPESYLAEPRIAEAGVLVLPALVADGLAELGGARLSGKALAPWTCRDRKGRNRLRLVAIALWLLAHPWFRGREDLVAKARAFLATGLDTTAKLVAADLFVGDGDRREELVRLLLHALDLRPAGESAAQAADRLETVSSVERERVIRESREQQKRAKAVREAMARKAAAEAAARYGRE